MTLHHSLPRKTRSLPREAVRVEVQRSSPQLRRSSLSLRPRTSSTRFFLHGSNPTLHLPDCTSPLAHHSKRFRGIGFEQAVDCCSEWTEEGQLWVQYVSSTPATRLDVINLQEQLDHRLLQRQARETGIDPVREELYGQCFDELIRQVTINCAERGLLLLRVRDEIRMTIAAYQTLYESSIAFGMCALSIMPYLCTQFISMQQILLKPGRESR